LALLSRGVVKGRLSAFKNSYRFVYSSLQPTDRNFNPPSIFIFSVTNRSFLSEIAHAFLSEVMFGEDM
jgi:hypothetical protein